MIGSYITYFFTPADRSLFFSPGHLRPLLLGMAIQRFFINLVIDAPTSTRSC
jgi:hypothetical protein